MKCKICRKKFNNAYSLHNHLRGIHKISSKDYYDMYIKKPDEGVCKQCGKPTRWSSITKGYVTFCSHACSNRNEQTRNNVIKTNLKRRGVKNVSQDKTVIEKAQRKQKEKYGDLWAKSKEGRKKLKEQNSNPEKIKKYENTMLDKYGYKYYCQDPDNLKNLLKNRGIPKSEKYFSKLLRKAKIEFKKEFYINSENIAHNFDFAIFKNQKLKCLVEIDGEYFHGLLNDNVGYFKNIDEKRWDLVPNKVKFLVIDSNRLDEGFIELQRILPMKYKDWRKEMLRSIPKNIEDALPKFSKKRMLKDWNNLKKFKYREGAYICKSILLNFCKSRIIESLGNEWKSLRKTLYKSPCSSHHLLEGFDIFKNPSKLREKFRKRYKGVKEVIVKQHSPEKMLAICSLGKIYISKERIDKESKRIIKLLNLKAFSNS